MVTCPSQLGLSGRAETGTPICLAASNLPRRLRQRLFRLESQPPQEEVGDAKVSLPLRPVTPRGPCRPRLPTALQSPAGHQATTPDTQGQGKMKYCFLPKPAQDTRNHKTTGLPCPGRGSSSQRTEGTGPHAAVTSSPSLLGRQGVRSRGGRAGGCPLGPWELGCPDRGHSGVLRLSSRGGLGQVCGSGGHFCPLCPAAGNVWKHLGGTPCPLTPVPEAAKVPDPGDGSLMALGTCAHPRPGSPLTRAASLPTPAPCSPRSTRQPGPLNGPD